MLDEALVYGSTMLALAQGPGEAETDTARRLAGRMRYLLQDHLGNIRAEVADQKDADLVTGSQLSLTARILSGKNYYPFGMAIQETGTAGSRYGYNGKPQDSRLGGVGREGSYDYGFRAYDASLARFFAVDPLREKYPELTPYQFASNTPIQAIDLDGLEAVFKLPFSQLIKSVSAVTSEDCESITVTHHWSNLSISETVPKEGLGEAEAKSIQASGFWVKAFGVIQNPSILGHYSAIRGVGAMNTSNTGFDGGTIYLASARQMVGNLRSPRERANATKWDYENTFLHILMSSINTATFGVSSCKFLADIHERDFSSLFTGEGADSYSEYADAYKDLVNNAWGRRLGTKLAHELKIEPGKAWTTEQASGFLNGVQDYFSSSFPSLKFRNFDSKYVEKFKEQLNASICD